jgi:cytochrome d ubiquinol oxidase subunit I
VKLGIPIPKGLSLLAFHDPNAVVQGLDAVPEADRPPVNVTRIAFQLMVSIGTFLAALSAWYLFARTRRKRVPSGRWFHRLLVVAGPASVIALIAGWVTTEVGRQPWVVYHVMRTTDAVTAAHGIPVGYATLAAFYGCLIVAVAWILRRLARAPMATVAEPERALGGGEG